jgi:hypothetical protein
MLTLLTILGIWTVLSIPMSVVLGLSINRETHAPELVGMDGDVAVYRRDGRLERVPLFERSAA